MGVSACLLTLNEDRWIDLCIEHMYDYVDEIVCLDAGSTDNTINILKRYDKIKYFIINQPPGPRGVVGWCEGDRRNIIQHVAREDWILCLGCDELLDDMVWEKLDNWLKNDYILGYGFYRINYHYNLEYHKPIHQPANGGEVRLYRNDPNIRWSQGNAHNFLYHMGTRMHDSTKVINTKYLIHHLHRTNVRGPAFFDRRNEDPSFITEEYVKKSGFLLTKDNNYLNEIKFPSILKKKGLI